MDDQEIIRLFETSFPEIGAYTKEVREVLEVLVCVPESISLLLLRSVLEKDATELFEPIEALHELIRVDGEHVSFFYPELAEWLCDEERSGQFALQSTKFAELGDVLWCAYKDLDNTPFQQEVLEWLPKFIKFTSLWEGTEDNARELNNFAHYLSGRGRLEPSVELYFRVLQIAEEIGKIISRLRWRLDTHSLKNFRIQPGHFRMWT